jgi:GAF domain-containing protein
MSKDEQDRKRAGALELASSIYEIGLLAHQSSDLEEVLQAIVERVLEETDADFAGIGLVDWSVEEMVHTRGVVRGGEASPIGHRSPLGRGVVGTVARTGKPMVLDDVREFHDYIELVPGIRSEATVPLETGGKVIGVLDVESGQKGKFGAEALALLKAVAAPVAMAVQNARLFQDERRRSSQLALLNAVSRIITSTVDLDELLQRTVASIREQLDYYLVAVGLVDEDTDRVVLRAADTVGETELPIGHSQAVGEGVTGQVAQTGKSILVHDVSKWSNYVSIHPDIRCEMCCPLKAGDRVFGFLDAESTRVGAFDEDDLMVFETLADHISQAVQNARTLRRMDRLREELSGRKIRDYIDQAQRAGDQMMVLITSFLGLQKMEAGALRLSLKPMQAGDLVRSVAEGMSVVARSKDVTLEWSVDDDVPATQLDRELAARILENVVGNAVKFTPAGGRVDVSVRLAPEPVLGTRLPSADQAVQFSISDTGSGIPPDECERIFEKFAVARSRREGRKDTIGLGLAFCKRAVMAHGGAIWVESELKKGSTFHILLPVNPPVDSKENEQ